MHEHVQQSYLQHFTFMPLKITCFRHLHLLFVCFFLNVTGNTSNILEIYSISISSSYECNMVVVFFFHYGAFVSFDFKIRTTKNVQNFYFLAVVSGSALSCCFWVGGG